MAWVYILKCNDNSLYTGWTNSLEKRIAKHSKGNASKYTRARLPVRLVYTEKMENKQEALKREFSIKKMCREEKLSLIKNTAR
ncbi:GIY-YIG nuclease family protein [Tindallia californiensis]|uniref:GIY-YIG nuclease family protein n=1 Tax=Tindallia californiensis TaxID=159292 RepID=UPI000B899F10